MHVVGVTLSCLLSPCQNTFVVSISEPTPLYSPPLFSSPFLPPAASPFCPVVPVSDSILFTAAAPATEEVMDNDMRRALAPGLADVSEDYDSDEDGEGNLLDDDFVMQAAGAGDVRAYTLVGFAPIVRRREWGFDRERDREMKKHRVWLSCTNHVECPASCARGDCSS